MSPGDIGVIGICCLILLFLLGMPVAFAMGVVGFCGLIWLTNLDGALLMISRVFFEELSSYPLSVIPMFVLMGTFASASGISERLYRAAYTWLGHWRGGLGIATIFACASFGAICGSSTATTAAMGQIALPEMRKYGYDDSFASGTVAAGGTLGILIPPSTVLIIYGILTEQSIGKLFVAGILPGILVSLLFALTVYLTCLKRPEVAPRGKNFTFKEKVKVLVNVTEVAILFALALGGLFLGWFSPTQAGAVGAAGALVIGLARGKLNKKALLWACREGLRTSCMVFFIIVGATLFGYFIAVTRIPFELIEFVESLNVPSIVVMVIIMLTYFFGGFFMDSMALIVLTVPIFYPLVTELGFDPIWFGVIIVLLGEMGVLTPPVGVNVFVVKGIVQDVPIEQIFKGIIPFVVALIIATVIITVFPIIVTFLPAYITY